VNKIVKVIAGIVVVLTLTGCGWFDRKIAAITGGASKTCVDGVMYLQFTSGAAVQYSQDGKVVDCK